MKKIVVGLLLLCVFVLPTMASGAQETSTSTKADAIAKADEGLDAQTLAFLEGKDFTGQTLVVGVWGGVIEDIIRENIIPPLEARGANIELLLGGTADRLSKIYMEKDNPTMDICYLNLYECQQAMADGITEAPSDKIPAYNDLYDLAKIGGYGQSFMGLGIAYNPDFFDTPPKWSDLWNPEFKGKIAFPNYPGSEGDGFLAIAARLNGGDEHDIDKGFEKLQELCPIPLIYTNLDELFMMMDAGDVVAAPVINGYAWTYIDKGLNIAYSWPTEVGSVKMMDTLTIVANNKHPELSEAWTQLAMCSKTQKAYAEQIYFGPTNSTVKLTGDAAERTVYGDKVDSLIDLDWLYIIDQRAEWTNRWNKDLVEYKGN
ncbi:MAG: extracellular solute-binding protein [Sphaerochaetaceae bacterium]|nr:extracellular solute-binding protein [Sphaerochaetaceae bacterium]